MARLLFFLGVAVVLILLARWLFRQSPRVYWQWLVIGLVVTILLLVVTGRAHWLTAVIAAMLPFLRTAILFLLNNLPLLRRMLAGMGAAKSAAGPSSGQHSSVQSQYIRMTLEHDSGDLDGEVLNGQFRGRLLSTMRLEELLQLLNECRDDEESVALLQAYLDRVHADEWRQQADARDRQQPSGESGEMSREEAFQVLGLSPGAGEAEIIEAHRRLMQKLHPDRGGSAYLAARINLAKDILLGK